MFQSKTVLNAIQRYDRKLYVKWNNSDHVWEVWRSMPWGDKLITPITKNIFQEGQTQTFAPLDYRIVYWLYEADSQKKDLPLSWKFKRKIKFKKHKNQKERKYKTKLKNAAQDNYYLLNKETLNPYMDETGWKRPEIQSQSRKRVMYRKEYYDGNRDNRFC